MSETTGWATPRGLVRVGILAMASAALLVLVGCSRGPQDTVAIAGSEGPDEDGTWETFHEFGHWALDADRETIQIERSTIESRCADHRVVIADDAASPWLLRFETRITAEVCPAAGCIDCPVRLSLDRPVPTDVEVRAVCDPDSSIFATTVPGGAGVTLRQPPDGSEPVVCSPTPEPSGTLPSSTTPPAQDHDAAELCTEPPTDCGG